MKKLLFIVFILLFSGCSSIILFEEAQPEYNPIEPQYETPYNRYLRHHFYSEEIPGHCRYCGAVTCDLEITICEECYYKVNKIKREPVIVEPLQFNERFYIQPRNKSFTNVILQAHNSGSK